MISDSGLVIINLKSIIINNNTKEILNDIIYLIHHILVSAFILYFMKVGFGATIICYLLVIYEISTIFLSLAQMLRDIEFKQHALTTIFEFLFAFTFIIMRIGWGSFIIAYLIFEEDCPLIIKIMLMKFQLLNYFWLYCLIKVILYRSKKSV